MAKLTYSAIASLDGYVQDEQGKFDWAAPGDEVHEFVNDLERPIGTYLYGRRMYETMVFWETASTGGDQPAVIRDFAEIWRAAEKPRLPELPPDAMVTVCGDRRCKRGTMVTGWLDKKQHEMLIALHEDPQSVGPP